MLFRLPSFLWRRTRHRLHVRLRTLLYVTIGGLLFAWLCLPYDNTIRLAIRFNVKRIQAALGGRPSENWVFAPPRRPINLREDALVIVKTGYGTQQRVQAWFESLSDKSELHDFLLVGDYTSQPHKHFVYRGQELPVHDVVNQTLSQKVLSNQQMHPRVIKYQELTAAIESGDKEHSLELAKSSGWELDALKFISALELAYAKFPYKKWFILVDDDTYLIQPSLKQFLSQLDAEHPYYLGNVVGSFSARFAHGGSAIILSHKTMRNLLLKNQPVVSRAHSETLSEPWGDRLLARTLIRTGVFLDERWSHLFSGETPRLSKIRADRFCSPILSFHSLHSPKEMVATGKLYQDVKKPVLWIDLWEMFRAPAPWRSGVQTVRQNWDHVGDPETGDPSTVSTVWYGVKTADECAKKCKTHSKVCMAWAWSPKFGNQCRVSPWMTVGHEAEHVQSGFNEPRVKKLEMNCFPY
ncbi:hypothetical protein B0T26DRAFT_146874 [Lasiosphaeria miniovina]|uniref:N-acetylgalactosaminide beta-1,3-galactosyltransferase n=1 Tax=Lasiosphaeria miniovina TaxID=1954250 RepID=A0AA40B507_9PEZI|nr:uncharacterized protein B0T26DRAFT_146874 [Lasiosphaeria miniovina]KAK0727844.1 hypothetical protein B0T26DRAFT_146874 [Lasiosphaeria miniovina]